MEENKTFKEKQIDKNRIMNLKKKLKYTENNEKELIKNKRVK